MPQNKFIQSPSAVAAELGDGIVILNTASRKYFRLNKVGALIWGGIGDGHDKDVIVDRLKDCFSSDADRISDDVSALIDQLLNASLISRADDDAE